jgi:hypothetical protein
MMSRAKAKQTILLGHVNKVLTAAGVEDREGYTATNIQEVG